MAFLPVHGCAGVIVEELSNGPLPVAVLIKKVQERRHGMTVQGVYKALRALRQEDIVFLSRKQAMLNVRWLQELDRFVAKTEFAYKDPSTNSGHFLDMHDGDKIVYSFRNPVQIDAFWNHVLYVLFDTIPHLDRWYAYSSHCWFLIGRRKEELALRDYMTGHGIRYLFTVGHRTALDHAITRDFDGTKAQYHMLATPLFKERQNNLGIVLNVVGDYVIEAQYDKQTTKRIEQFYASHTHITLESTAELERIVSAPVTIKLTITRKAAKAQKLAKLFEKHFYFGK
jgi:hypothetical protein